MSYELMDQALPEGYRIAWKFCWVPTMHQGRSIWLRSIPVIQRQCKHVVNAGVPGETSWTTWVTVAIIDAPLPKPLPVDEY